MKLYEIAIDKDINKQYHDAVIYYQESINQKELNLDVYLNLAFLYWIFHDFGFTTHFNISEELRNVGYDKYSEIIKKGLSKFPDNIELNFWKKYFQHIIYDEEFSENDCQELLNKYGDDSIVPYFFIYLFNKEKYELEKAILLNECDKQPTAKNLYIKSILTAH